MIEIRAFAIKTKRGAAEPYVYCREIGRHDALVRITHRSITRGDIQFIENDWGDTRFPLVPAHEIVGVVEEIGPDVTELRRGDRVGIGFQLGACFECDYCRHGTEQFCPNQTVVGVNAYGGLAEQIIVDAYGPEEQALGWYYWLEGQLRFPFRARCIAEGRISPLRKGEER